MEGAILCNDSYTLNVNISMSIIIIQSFWLSDKVNIQEELANVLTDCILSFKNFSISLLYVKSFFQTMLREWSLLDQYRINKMYVLLRKMTNRIIKSILMDESKNSAQFLAVIEEEILKKTPNGIRFHISDVFIQELHNVLIDSSIKLNNELLITLLNPFLNCLTRKEDSSVVERVYKSVFLAFLELYNEDDKIKSNIDLTILQKVVFDLASDENTLTLCRKKLYDLHKDIASKSHKLFITSPVIPQPPEIQVQPIDKHSKSKQSEEIIKKRKNEELIEKEVNDVILGNDIKSAEFIQINKFAGKKDGFVFKNVCYLFYYYQYFIVYVLIIIIIAIIIIIIFILLLSTLLLLL